MVASKVLNSHLKTIRGIVVKNFAKIDIRFDSLDERICAIEHTLKIKNQKDQKENKPS